MKPICIPCQRFMRPKRNGYYFIEGMPHGEDWDGTSGKDSPGWLPYKVWVGDLYECPDCHAQAISGVARLPVSEHYLPDFQDLIARTGADRLMVKDC